MIRYFIFVTVLIITIFSCKSQKIKLSSIESNHFIESFRANALTQLSDGSYYPHLRDSGFGALYYYSYVIEKQDKNRAMSYLLDELKNRSAFSDRAAIRYALLAFDGGKVDPLFSRRLDQMLSTRQYKDRSTLLFARATISFLEKDYSQATLLLRNVDRDVINLYSIGSEVDALNALVAKGLDSGNSRLLLDTFFLNRKASLLTLVSFNHLKYITHKRDHALYDLYEAMALSHQGLTAQAFKLADGYLNSDNDLSFLNNNEHFFTHYANLAGRAGQRSTAASTLEKKLHLFVDRSYATASLAIASLNRHMGSKNFDNSLVYIDRAVKSSLSNDDFDRALWYSLDISKKSNFEKKSEIYFKDLEKIAPLWYKKAYFNDILESTLATLVQNREFKLIYRLYYSVVRPFADRVSVADYAWVLAQAIEHDVELESYLPHLSTFDWQARVKSLHQSLMNDTLLDPASYAAFMTAAVTKKLPQPLRAMGRPPQDDDFKIDGRVRSVKILAGDIENRAFQLFRSMSGAIEPISNDLHILGFFYYAIVTDDKILSMVNTKINEQLPLLSTDLIRLMARQHNLNGDYLRAIRLMHRIKWRDNFNPNLFDYQIMYPKVFSNEIEIVTKEYRINPFIFYGLIRQESGFSPSIVSSAKAVGLAQIMPASANEFSTKLGIASYDLTDPYTNLIFGAYYMDWMNRRQNDGMYSVLMGYNAGPTRARRWMRDWIDLPSAIAVEAIPYHETRNYIKNIVVSSAIYGYIYEGIEPYETIREVFPDILKSYNDFIGR